MKNKLLIRALSIIAAAALLISNNGIRTEAKWLPENNYACDYWICSEKNNVCYCYGDQLTLEQKQVTLEKAKQIVSMAPTTAHEKVKYFHDIICQSTVYSLDRSYKISSPYGLLIQGKAKCAGYSNTLQLLCDLSGIPCMQVCGLINNGKTYHGWNIVQLEDGQWYEVDCTNDDTDNASGPSYAYFLLTTEQISKTNTRGYSTTRPDGSVYNETNEGVPIAYGTKFGQPIRDEEEYKKSNNLCIKDDTGAEFSINTKNDTCSLIGLPKNASSYTVPDTITYKGHVLTVDTIVIAPFITSRIKKLVIGKNIRTIKKSSYSKCKRLKYITINSDILTKVEKNAFKGISSSPVVKIPRDKTKTYKKLLKRSGLPQSTKYKKF